MGRNKYRVFVGLYFRQGITRNPKGAQLGHARFHWSIWVEPKNSSGPGYTFEVIEEDIYENVPGSGGWRMKHREADRTRSVMMVGRIMIGKLPDGISPAEVKDLLKVLRLPNPKAAQLENCVSWTIEAIKLLQQKGWAEQFDVKEFMDHALQRASLWVKNQVYPERNSVENYTSRPM